jgi:8-oxo-dGTP pyrophosphatase MutT (NUDIX family)
LTRRLPAASVRVVLDLDEQRPLTPPRPAATLVLLRDGTQGIEVCVMQRSLESAFLGGAVVFPGGRVEASDASTEWREDVATRGSGQWWDAEGFASRVAACREALEEVGVAPTSGATDPISTHELAQLRESAAQGASALRERLRVLGRALDLAALTPLSRWMTPEAEKRRFDARFFVARAPAGVEAQIDRREAIRTFWATPQDLLDQYEAGRIALFPPTHRTLARLLDAANVEQVLRAALDNDLSVICPRFVVEEGLPMLVLPGDPLHQIPERRIAGGTRYVLRGDRWASEGE